MQRWWYIDDTSRTTNGNDDQQKFSTPRSRTSTPRQLDDRKWTFKVHTPIQIGNNEIVAIAGDCEQLGNWKPNDVFLMERVEGSDIWAAVVDIPSQRVINYRYLICAIDPATQTVHVRQWETHITPRNIPSNTDTLESFDTFGDIGGLHKVDRGWLTNETIFQFSFYNNPFMLTGKAKNKLIYVKLTPMNLRVSSEAQDIAAVLEESLSNDTRENGTEQPAYAFTECVSLRSDDEAKLEPLSQFGRAYHPDDILIFHVTVTEPENVAYLIDLYTYSSRACQEEPPRHVGYHYILPNLLKKSEGQLDLPVTCASKHRPLGMMRVEYLKITPFCPQKMNLKTSYVRHWNPKWKGLEIGHRGSGTSFKSKDGNLIRENTIASLKKACAHGADMVEFDVQLSKDLVPVIYHDFSVYVCLKRKKQIDTNDMLELPMGELTLEQLNNLKVYHVEEGKSREPRFFDEDLEEHQPFPTLAKALEAIDPHVGFNVEVKWSMRYSDGTRETNYVTDKNLYVDCILDVVLNYAGNRRIVFSCFDPDICTMLRFKQNLYPVMFLTCGDTAKYPKYYDPRCNSHGNAIKNACAMELLGIVGNSEDLLRKQESIQQTIDNGLIIFCWGEENNCSNTIRHLKNLGLHAIIYDKMDVFSTKERKIRPGSDRLECECLSCQAEDILVL
ncbi:glycerophosphocholine phosphodiesterase GPCPD1 isoform X2 [Phlebotomus papatasi]|uniref:glycerophosphocholine phosphodiesterase GPCPD1 isoform X2 n=1 Tax=Phlebotomus papatasi TaxID=29031 RepID=UPI002483921B|nr:glycerophosphocholine phosphodiesterase GPCPD1 isoform X2 [Phlebotomus papatasi]